MKIIVGLGNPGDKYSKNRHNVGYIILDNVFSDEKIIWEKKFSAMIAKLNYMGEKLILVKPTTYMNLSGKAILEVTNFYKIDAKDILVIHDDIYLKPNQIKVKIGGSDAGHNGIKSIDSVLGTNMYYRLRYGVGNLFLGDLSDYVLSDFNSEEIQNIIKNKTTILEVIKEFIQK